MPLGTVTPLDPPLRSAHSTQAAAAQRAVDSLARAVIVRNPFRIARSPAAKSYDPGTFGQPEAPPPPRPVLAVVGVVAGIDPTAVVEGLPGTDGARVVRVGDVVGSLRIQAIAGEKVRIVGMDTVWVLPVRTAW